MIEYVIVGVLFLVCVVVAMFLYWDIDEWFENKCQLAYDYAELTVLLVSSVLPMMFSGWAFGRMFGDMGQQEGYIFIIVDALVILAPLFIVYAYHGMDNSIHYIKHSIRRPEMRL